VADQTNAKAANVERTVVFIRLNIVSAEVRVSSDFASSNRLVICENRGANSRRDHLKAETALDPGVRWKVHSRVTQGDLIGHETGGTDDTSLAKVLS
jgi:hypothetical protein